MNIKNPLPTGTILKGKSYNYRIEKTLGQGSFGITYLATVKMQGALGELDSNIQVAVKEFFMKETNGRDGNTVTTGSKGGVFDKYRTKFAREAQNLSKLHHPKIVKVLESFEANNTVYYTMEYIDGGNLDNYIQINKGLSEKESIKYLTQIGEALSYMHHNKMLHLDLKPANIVLRKNGEAVLIDFGLAKQYDDNGKPETSTSVGLGTPGYAPIEQSDYRDGKGFPMEMDVYALGATFFKMLSGVRPPDASSILNDGFPIYELQEHHVSDSLISVVAKAMAPLKKNRYQSVEEFMAALNDGGTKYDEPEDTVLDQEIRKTENKSTNKDLKQWGSYITKQLGTNKYIKSPVLDPLPMPNEIYIKLINPNSSRLSYLIYLYPKGFSTIFIYCKGNNVGEVHCDGIPDDVLNYLIENGFFSKEHWERETSTIVQSTGYSVTCSFLYKDGKSFTRNVSPANYGEHYLLLMAVENLINTTSLRNIIEEYIGTDINGKITTLKTEEKNNANTQLFTVPQNTQRIKISYREYGIPCPSNFDVSINSSNIRIEHYYNGVTQVLDKPFSKRRLREFKLKMDNLKLACSSAKPNDGVGGTRLNLSFQNAKGENLKRLSTRSEEDDDFLYLVEHTNVNIAYKIEQLLPELVEFISENKKKLELKHAQNNNNHPLKGNTTENEKSWLGIIGEIVGIIFSTFLPLIGWILVIVAILHIEGIGQLITVSIISTCCLYYTLKAEYLNDKKIVKYFFALIYAFFIFAAIYGLRYRL